MASLNPKELEIMKILWEDGPLKPAEIQERLSFEIKNSALRWQLGELVEQGQITRRKAGKAFVYRAKAPQRRVLKSLTNRLAQVFAGGSAMALIGEMIDSQDGLTEEDIRELQKIAERKAATGHNPNEK